MSRPALLALALLLAAGPAWGLRATPHLDVLEATLADRAAALAGATDRTAKKQLRAAEKALARIDVDTTSLAEDLKLAKKIAGPVGKVGSGVSLQNILDLFNVNVASFEVKGEVDVAASPTARTTPDGSLAFTGPVALGEEVEATVVLKT
jgi:hypothetical protein